MSGKPVKKWLVAAMGILTGLVLFLLGLCVAVLPSLVKGL